MTQRIRDGYPSCFPGTFTESTQPSHVMDSGTRVKGIDTVCLSGNGGRVLDLVRETAYSEQSGNPNVKKKESRKRIGIIQTKQIKETRDID